MRTNLFIGASNGTLPLNEDNMLKWWGQYIFKNTQTIAGRQISAPPAASDYAQWAVPDALVQDVEFANKATFGKRGEAWKVTQHRICWWVADLCPLFSLCIYLKAY